LASSIASFTSSVSAFSGRRIDTPSSPMSMPGGRAADAAALAADAAGSIGRMRTPCSSMLISTDLCRLPPSFAPAAEGARTSVRSLPQGVANGGMLDRMPVTISASSASTKKRSQLMLSSQRA
jgi:hypothetical protein